jgi:hypothetical protein
MRFGKLIGLLLGSLVLSMARAARVEVIINYPTNGATVNGTITVTAQITSAWWSNMIRLWSFAWPCKSHFGDIWGLLETTRSAQDAGARGLLSHRIT